MDTERRKSNELNSKLLAAEQRANEVQKKYDALKGSYFKIKESHERLKSGSGQASGDTNQAAAAEGAASSAPRPTNGTGTTELQSKYDQLKTKFRVSSLYTLLN